MRRSSNRAQSAANRVVALWEVEPDGVGTAFAGIVILETSPEPTRVGTNDRVGVGVKRLTAPEYLDADT